MIDLGKCPPRFSLGQVYATAGFMALGLDPRPCLLRHSRGDWGDVDPEDWAANESALQAGSRLLSTYRLGGRKIYIITEADRSTTTVLLPEEY